ncbi:MAG: exopolysaccharide biosynthesis protein [Sulfitobacter sp.]
MTQDTSSLNGVLDALEDQAKSHGTVTVGDVVQALGGRGFGPLLVVAALLVISPLGGVPGFPTAMAVLIGLIAVQMVAQRQHLWLPKILRERGVKGDKLSGAVDKLRGAAGWIDKHFGGRVPRLVEPPMPSIAAALIAVLCLLVPPSEVIPFAALLPMGGIAVLGLALTLRDGVLMGIGIALAVAALVMLVRVVM